MDIEFSIHRVSVHPVPVTVKHEGEDVSATIDELEVECLSKGGRHGTLVLRFRGTQTIARVRAAYKEGDTLTFVMALPELAADGATA